MRFTPTSIAGVVVIDAEPYVDDRGVFRRSFCVDEYKAAGLDPVVLQGNFSHNHRAFTMRGFHFQTGGHQEAKTISCVSGAVHDIVVDLRPTSSTYCKWFSIELTAESMRSIYVPRGCANAFLTLADQTVCHYYVATKFAPGNYAGFHWNDPQFSFDWPRTPEVVSDKDARLPNFDPSIL